MIKLIPFLKSTRSILAVLSMLLLFVIVFGYFFGASLPSEIITLVGTTIGAVTTAYFGKRDNDK